jgi:hypothetical protein
MSSAPINQTVQQSSKNVGGGGQFASSQKSEQQQFNSPSVKESRVEPYTVTKIISPAERSVFKPTFLIPRVEQGVSPPPVVLEAQHVSVSSKKGASVGKRDGYSALEEAFMRDAKGEGSTYQNPYSKDDSPGYNGPGAGAAGAAGAYRKYYSYEDEEGEDENGSGQHSDGDDSHVSRHKKKKGAKHAKGSSVDHPHPHHGQHQHHAHPPQWFVAGAYNSHSEATEAIARMHKVLVQHGAAGAGGDGGSEDERQAAAAGRFRLQRDLSRMQWVVESCDTRNKKLLLASKASVLYEKEKSKYRDIVSTVSPEHGGHGGLGGHAGIAHHGYHESADIAHLHHQQQLQQDHLHQDHHLAPAVAAHLNKKDDKYQRERDQALENNIRAIRNIIPKEDYGSPSRAHQGGKAKGKPKGGGGAGKIAARAEGVKLPVISAAIGGGVNSRNPAPKKKTSKTSGGR